MRTVRVTAMLAVAVLSIGAASVFPWRSAEAGRSTEAAASLSSVDVTDIVRGQVAALASSVRQDADGRTEGPSISFLLRTPEGYVTVLLTENAQVRAHDGRIISGNEIPLSAHVLAYGNPLSETQFEATRVELLQ
jgi:hypothetical protein